MNVSEAELAKVVAVTATSHTTFFYHLAHKTFGGGGIIQYLKGLFA